MNTSTKSWCQKADGIITLMLYVQPGSKHNEIVGMHGDALKIKLATQPIEGRANKALLHYIAKLFDVPLSQVTLKRGKKSRNKTIEVRASHFDWTNIGHTILKQGTKKP